MIDEAVAGGVLDEQQGHALWQFLVRREVETPSFRPAHILCYLGGLVAISAMTVFMTFGWERFGGDSTEFFSDRGKFVSMYFGLAMAVVALLADFRSDKTKDFAFWLYLFGVLTFWSGLSSMHSDSELNKFIYCCVNLLMIAIGAALSRRVFAIFGGLGVALYLGHLSHTIFKDSMLFPVALAAIGLAIIGAGVYWQRHEAAIGERLRFFLPTSTRDLIARRGE